MGTPSREEIAAIIGLDAAPALRNLRITQCYHELSRSIGVIIGAKNANWCTFATWASKTAGRFVRGEVIAMLRDALQDDARLAAKIEHANRLLRRLHAAARLDQTLIIEALKAPAAEVSRHITAGNLAVFAELAPVFSLMCARLGEPRNSDAGVVAGFIKELQLTSGPPEQGGQGLLRNALLRFYQARFTSDSDRKAELMLLGNAETALHEQLRLQPAIVGSLELPADAVRRVLFDRLFAGEGPGTVGARMRRLLEKTPVWAELQQELRRIWRQCATRILMTLHLPDGEIHLGRDLRPKPGDELFPRALQEIAADELRALLSSYGAAGSSAAQSGAADWTDIAERMQFILTLFRARQQGPRLFEPPFTSSQTSAIAMGRLPDGAL